MLDAETIYDKVNDLIKKHGTRDPFTIAEDLNIMISDEHDLNNLLGVFTYKWRHRIILINSKLGGRLKTMTVSHELGHAVLHVFEAKTGALKEFSMFKLKSTTEYEANAFAAHLLIDDDDILELIYSGYSIDEIAQGLEVYPQLVAIKIKELIRLGHKLPLPCDINSCFLKDVEINEEYD